MHPLKSLCLLVALLSIAVSDAACNPACNCPNTGPLSFSFPFPASLDVQVTASGAACPGGAVCEGNGDGGACVQYGVRLNHTGSCQVTATAIDGRLQSVEYSIGTEDLGCCGSRYVIQPGFPADSLSFSQDASAD